MYIWIAKLLCSVLLIVSTELRPFSPSRLSLTLVLAKRRATSFYFFIKMDDEPHPFFTVFLLVFFFFFKSSHPRLHISCENFSAGLINI